MKDKHTFSHPFSDRGTHRHVQRPMISEQIRTLTGRDKAHLMLCFLFCPFRALSSRNIDPGRRFALPWAIMFRAFQAAFWTSKSRFTNGFLADYLTICSTANRGAHKPVCGCSGPAL
mgnify:CR=1 FL=1